MPFFSWKAKTNNNKIETLISVTSCISCFPVPNSNLLQNSSFESRKLRWVENIGKQMHTNPLEHRSLLGCGCVIQLDVRHGDDIPYGTIIREICEYSLVVRRISLASDLVN